MVFLLLFIGLIVAAAAPVPHCTSDQWFWANVKSLFVQPLLDHTALVMAPADNLVSVCEEPRGQSCAALGVANGMDVLAVWLRVTVGWHFPLVPHEYCALINCPRLSTVATTTPVQRQTCQQATRTLHCAQQLWIWGALWMTAFVALVAMFILALALYICAGRGNSSYN